MSDALLIAAYENRRLLVLNTFLNHPNKIPPALAFAYEHRLAPLFHEEIREHYGTDPYEDIYAVRRDFITDVSEWLDQRWLDKDYEGVKFSKLENAFGGYKANRMELVFSLKYMRLDRRFDDELFKAVMKDAPVEAQGVMQTYEPKDVDLF